MRFLGPLGHTNRIRHDITLKERMVLKPERRVVAVGYPDLRRFQVLVYPEKEILAEKIRSIMQRGYSRDYYDVWRLMKEHRFGETEIKTLLIKKCRLNDIEYEPDLLFDDKRLDEVRSHWEPGLRYLMKDLPDYERVVSELRTMLAFLGR